MYKVLTIKISCKLKYVFKNTMNHKIKPHIWLMTSHGLMTSQCDDISTRLDNGPSLKFQRQQSLGVGNRLDRSTTL